MGDMTDFHICHADPSPRPWVGIYGPAGVGKDTLAAALIEHFEFERVAFADPVREMALRIDPYVHTVGMTARLSTVVDEEGWDQAKRAYSDVRRLLQRLGTEGVREIVPSFWTDLAEDTASSISGPVVFPDVRFETEAEMVKRNGGVIVQVEGGTDLEGLASFHASEHGMAEWPADIVFQNPHLDSVYEIEDRMTGAAQAIVSYLLKGH